MNRNHKKQKHHKHSKSRSTSIFNENIIENDVKGPEIMFDIKSSKIMGRYMVAGKDFIPGEVILSELPLVVGPCAGCQVQCIACYQPLHEYSDFQKCKNCQWPLCSKTCSGINNKYGHTELECELLRECHSEDYLDYNNFDQMNENFFAIVPLRCLLLKTTDPKAYDILQTMEHHNDIRRNIPDVWNLNQKTIVDKIRKDWQLIEFTEDIIHSICGVLEVNSFEIGQNGINIRGLYPNAFLMSHDCVPNTNHSDEVTDYRLTVRASTVINVNQPITLSYAYTLQSTLKRRDHLRENKFFECHCARCKDPGEFGTHAGTLWCPKCQLGQVLSTDPLNMDAPWKCQANNCEGYSISAKSVELLLNRINEEIEDIDCNDIAKMEATLEKYRNVLYPSHYLNVGLKLSLSQLYGKIQGYLIHELTDDLLLRKTEVCKEILKIFNVIEPGYTRLRGVTLYELHAPIMVLTTRQFERQKIAKNELKLRLKEVIRYLEEASKILNYEPVTSSEGMMGIAAKEALDKIKDWGKIIGKL